MKCECSTKFKKQFFGFSHWWRYTKLRYYWRLFWAKLEYCQIVINGQVYWTDNILFNFSSLRLYNQFPGPCMTNDEYKHWFAKKNNENVRLIPEVEER